uniref:exosortase-dependent surface protein XDP1 n=1 Tax=Ningiella ruwaisensis TaxID=2364274 RepID=UPI0010A05DA3|nr:exosortase-dependent surface protein XDP1 [Ningiella ruwaisensis]
MKFKHLGIASLLITLSTFSAASSTVSHWDFTPSGDLDSTHITSDGIVTANVLTGTKHGVDLQITAWSSSLHGGRTSCMDNPGGPGDVQDKCIQRTQLTSYGNNGLGNINKDEGDDTPNHSVDNNMQDYDMILLSFSEAVNISSINTGWNYSYTNLDNSGATSRNRNNAGASAMAYTGSGTLSSNPFSSTDTWASILHDGWSNIGSDFRTNGSNGHIPITNGSSIFSRYWLIGAAHAVERNAGHITDHIKIAGVSFAKRTTGQNNVSAPIGMVALMFGAALWIRRKA